MITDVDPVPLCRAIVGWGRSFLMLKVKLNDRWDWLDDRKLLWFAACEANSWILVRVTSTMFGPRGSISTTFTPHLLQRSGCGFCSRSLSVPLDTSSTLLPTQSSWLTNVRFRRLSTYDERLTEFFVETIKSELVHFKVVQCVCN